MWEIILWACITFGVLCGIIILAYYFFSYRALKARRKEIIAMNDSIKAGKKCTFNGIHGKLISVGDSTCEVEIAKGVVLTISRYIITSID